MAAGRILKVMMALTICGLIAGCEGSPATVDMTGTWQGWDEVFGPMITATLTQTGNSVSGTFVDSEGDTGVFTGTVSGDEVDLIVSYDSYSTLRATITGTIRSGSRSASGLWSSGDLFSGQWSANKI